jgi:hypothetical protein
MPRPIIFSASIKGKPRLLLSIQERASGDLTIIVKHSIFRTATTFAKAADDDSIIEERYSIHRSLESATINAIKYTQVLKNGRRHVVRNYTEAMKEPNNRFSLVFMRRAGDVSHERYLFSLTKGQRVINLGEYDPEHFQPVFALFVSRQGRSLADLGNTDINVVRVEGFKHFNITMLAQFLVFNGAQTTRSIMPQTFRSEVISQAAKREREAMKGMAAGHDDAGVVAIFRKFEDELATTLMQESWNRLDESEKTEYAALYHAMSEVHPFLPNGTPYGEQHKSLLLAMNFIRRRYLARLGQGTA